MSISWTIGPFESSWLRAYYESPWSFEETVARLITASGQPARSDDDYKTSVSFEGTYYGRRFTLYDYKESRNIHIGGNNELNVTGLVAALNRELAAVEPTPYEAKEYYDERISHSFPVQE
jgi:hypothetical protein